MEKPEQMSKMMCWVARPDCSITEHHLSGTQSSQLSLITSLGVEEPALTPTHKNRPRLQTFHLSLVIHYGPLIYKFIENFRRTLCIFQPDTPQTTKAHKPASFLCVQIYLFQVRRHTRLLYWNLVHPIGNTDGRISLKVFFSYKILMFGP